ncbi:tripartite tricarboxylate transporter TctB family protein [Antarctobacter sp.]|uniref:tripartite tricarboxylate transporter TctB family protein n=1 Tax=Antarctobacter sp. TaxID=1872577 RepID=UPI003A909A7E
MAAEDQTAVHGGEAIRQSAVALLCLSVIAVFATQLGKIYVEPTDAGLGARGLPTTALVFGALLAGIQLARNIKPAIQALARPDQPADWTAARRTALLTVIAFSYVWAITLFQYALPTLVAMSGLLWLFGARGLVRLVLIPIIAVVAYYVLFFVLLGVFESPGTILQYDSYSFAYKLRQLIGLQ